MKNISIVCLNTAANKFHGIEEFFETNYGKIDIFCLQEIVSVFTGTDLPETLHRTLPFSKSGAKVNYPIITKALENYAHHFSPHIDFLESFAPEGNMMAIKPLSSFKKTIDRFNYGAFDIFAGQSRAVNVTLQWMLLGGETSTSSKTLPLQRRVVVLNVHGIWQKNSAKADTRLRLLQSRRIIQCLRYLKEQFNCEFILTGDFNLVPNTKSIALIEEFGLRNLITEYGIKDTRTKLYSKKIRYADYIFVSSGVIVNEFKVLPDQVSDHAPLYLNFSM